MSTKGTAQADLDRWIGVIDELAGRLAGARQQRDDTATRRRRLVLPAQTGDATAAAQLAELDAALAGLDREVADLAQALEDAEARRASAQWAVEEAEQAKRLARAAKLEAEAETAGASIDEALAKVAAGMQRVRALLVEAAELKGRPRRAGGGDPVKDALRGAMQHHGLAPPHTVRFPGLFTDLVAGRVEPKVGATERARRTAETGEAAEAGEAA